MKSVGRTKCRTAVNGTMSDNVGETNVRAGSFRERFAKPNPANPPFTLDLQSQSALFES